MQKLNLKKLCVGGTGFEDLRDWQEEQSILQTQTLKNADKDYQHFMLPFHDTRNMPRQSEALAGGSLYWIKKKKFFARQKIHLLEQRHNEEGKKFCRIWLEMPLLEVEPMRDRIFQGWRYLKLEDSPPDKHQAKSDDIERELQRLGLL